MRHPEQSEINVDNTTTSIQSEVADAGRGFFRRHDTGLILLLLFSLFVLVFYWKSIVISVHPGEEGVRWSRLFGTRTNLVYQEGTHLILPFDEMTIYNVRYQKVDRDVQVLSQDGLEIVVKVTIRFKPVDKLIGRLHQQVGPDYVETIIVPEVGTAVRTVIGQYRPEQLYATSFSEIEDQIIKLARKEVQERFVLLDDVLVRQIELPDSVSRSIQSKLQEEQASLAMQYRITREQQEAQRKLIEANGIKAFQDTVAQSTTDRMLQYKGIEATLELAKSPNAKVVIVGSGQGGLPIILGADAFAATPAR
jgi:regulator of protease activity HflC (stomatin/prohibitin superfamily)